MSTRHAAPDAPLSQNRYMSSPEYQELRGVSGSAVAAKAQLLRGWRKRSLIFFLQARSLQDGGLVRVAEEILALFRDRLGPAEFRALKLKPGQKLSDAETRKVWRACGRQETYIDFTGCADTEKAIPVSEMPHTVDDYFRSFVSAENLSTFLLDVCINPRLLIPEPGQPEMEQTQEQERTLQKYGDLREHDIKPATLRGFTDIIGALFEYQKSCAAAAESLCAKTNAARKILSTLHDGLRARQMVLVEAESDSGKSTAAKAHCQAYMGQSRYCSLQGITTKTSFFRALARASGLPSTYGLNASDLQPRIEDFYQRSKLQLVLDESQYCFSQGERIYSRPEIVDWIYTALCNHDVPVALIASPLFSRRMAQAADQIRWNFTQFERRIFRRPEFSAKPTIKDVELVARHHLPGADDNTIKFLCGQAQESHTPLTMLVNTITDARLMAEDDGRTEIRLADLKRAGIEHRIPTELQNRRAHDLVKSGRSGRRSRTDVAAPLQEPLSESEKPAQEPESENHFTGRSRSVAASETHPAARQRAPEFHDA